MTITLLCAQNDKQSECISSVQYAHFCQFIIAMRKCKTVEKMHSFHKLMDGYSGHR